MKHRLQLALTLAHKLCDSRFLRVLHDMPIEMNIYSLFKQLLFSYLFMMMASAIMRSHLTDHYKSVSIKSNFRKSLSLTTHLFSPTHVFPFLRKIVYQYK